MIVKKLRLQRGWSQEQLSLLSGLSTRTIQRIEKGQNLGLESLKSLAAVFETSIANLQEEPDMNTEFSVSIEERLAFERVKNIKAFYRSLIIFCVVIPMLFLINFMTNPHYIWAVWPLLGWGVGLLFKAIKVFGLVSFFGPEWEKRQIEKQLGRKL